MADKELQYKLILNVEDFKKSTSEANSEIKKVADETEKANKKIADSEKQLEKVQKDVALYTSIATTALSAVATASVNMANQFNEGFAKVSTLIPGATERVKELQESVLELSPAVGKTTSDLTEGLYEIISAFGDSAESSKILETAAKAASAGGATTKEAIQLLSAVTKGYGDTSAEANKKVSDLAFTTLKLGQTSMSDLATSIQKVTALSNQLNVSQEELFAIFSSGTGVIGGAAEVSTKLASVYNELLKPGTELQKTFEKLGVTTGNELIEKFGNLQGALNAIKGVADEVGKPINALFGSIEAGQLALYATGEGAKKLASDFTEMKDSVGATNTAFNETATGGVNSFGFQLQQLQLNAQKIAIKLGQELIPALQAVLTPISKIVSAIANASPITMRLIGTALKMAIAIGAVTTAIITYNIIKTKAIAVAKAFNATMAANPLGAVVVVVTSLIVALQSLCQWMDEAARKAHQEKIEAEKNTQSRYKEIASIREQIKAWAELNAIKDKNAKQKEKLRQLEQKVYDVLQIKPDENATANKRKSFQELVMDAKQKEGQLTALESQYKKQIDETNKSIKERVEYIKEEAGWYSGDLETNIKNRVKEDKELKNLNETLEAQKASLEKIKWAKLELLSIDEKDFTPAEKVEIEKPPKPTENPLNKKIAEQDDRLKALDEAYKREAEIIENSRATVAQKEKEKAEAESKYYNERLKLLKTFIDERMQAGASYKNAATGLLEEQHKTITAELTNTYDEIERITNEKLQAELAEINQIAENTKAKAETESNKKLDSGDFGNKNSSEAKLAKYKYEIATYEAKSLELNEKITALTKEDAEKHAEKIKALKQETAELETQKQLASENAKDAEKTSKTLKEAGETSSKIQEIGSAINQVVAGVAGLATDIIGQKQQEQAQKLAEKLAEIEREKNETLMALESEYLDWKEEKQIEAIEREEERREAEFEKQQAQLSKSLNETQSAFDQETNIQKAKNREKELEEKRRALEEAKRKKCEDDAERKRQKEERAQEIEMLNTKAMAQWQFQVASIEAQNASAQSGAQLARQVAQWEKASSITSLIVKVATETAQAAAAFMTPPIMAGHIIAAAVAGAQIGVVSAAPIPSGIATPAPLPPAPRPIKFARGGIVYPSTEGTPAQLASGRPAVIGEAGIPEIILPVTQENLEAVFKAQGITTNNANTTIAPIYNITISQNESESLPDVILSTLEIHDRQILSIVENAKRNTYVGD